MQKKLLFLALFFHFRGWRAFLLKPLFGWIVFIGFSQHHNLYSLVEKDKLSIHFWWNSRRHADIGREGVGFGNCGPDRSAIIRCYLVLDPDPIMTIRSNTRQTTAKPGIPTFPEKYGEKTTRVVIALSTGSQFEYCFWRLSYRD